MPVLASVSTWSDLNDAADNASEGATVNIINDITADGSSIGFLQKVLKLDFGNYKINGGSYSDESPLVFLGAGASETKLEIIKATFTGFDTENGIINGANPRIELTDVSFINNKGMAINNEGYNGLVINAKNSDVNFKNNTTYGIKSNSNVYLNAYDGKTITLDDAISIDNNFDGNLVINNSYKAGTDLNGTVILNKNVDFASSNGTISLGAKSAYKNGTLKLGVEPANSNDFRLSIGGEATLDMQNDNVDNLTMSRFSGSEDAPLHLKLDYNAQTGKMDLITVSDSSVGASTPSIIVDAINILVDGDATDTEFLNGLGRTVINVSTDVISAVKDNVTYLFKPKTDISERGAYKVSKASNITNLPRYIQDQYSLLGNDVAITEDMTLTEDLGTLTGNDRNVTIYGNGHTLDLNSHNGVNVANDQTLSFNNVTLKNSHTLFENEGTINLTSVVLNNTYANCASSSFLNFSGYNDFIEGVISSDGRVHLQSGTTNVRENFTLIAKSIFLGSTNGTKSPIVTLNNHGYIRVADSFAFNNANINNFGTLSLKSIIGSSYKPTKFVNNGTISMDSGSKFYVQQNSEFINNLGAILNGDIKNAGIITNEGKLNNDVINFNKYRHDRPPYYGKLTSNIDNIAGLIYQQGDSSEDSIFNVTGGTINDAQKIKNYDGENGGIVNILGAVKSQARLDNYRGKTYVKNGGELQVAGSETSKIFTTGGNVNFENGSTLNLRESTIPTGQKFSPDNLVLAENDTLNLKMKDGLTLNVTDSSAKGNFSLKELEIKDGTLQSWKLINDDNNLDIYKRTSLDSDLKLIKTASSASGVNFVTYDNSVGNISYGTKDLQSALDEVKYVNKENDYFYEMSGQESAISDFSKGRFIVNGNNKTISNSDISIDNTGTLVLTNANLKDTTLATGVNGQLVIRNSSGSTIKLDNTIILNGSNNRNSSVRFEGNSDINFNGKYMGMFPSETVALDLENATLTRSGNDHHAFWILNNGTLKYSDDSYLANGGMNAITFNGGNLDLRNGVASNIPLYGLALKSNSNIFVDVDLANKSMDKLTANNSSYTGGKLNVAGMNLLSDAINDFTSINFTEDNNLKSNVAYTGDSQVAYSPIYKYNVNYNANNGNFEFKRGNGGGGGNASDAFNPAVLTGPVGAQLGSYLTQLNTYEQAFANMDMLMLMPRAQRIAMKYANKYASTQGTGEGGVITFSPNQIPEEQKGLWFRPFATFENVGLKNGPNVKNIGYGSLFGGDSDLLELKHGWDMQYSFYGGYNGSNQYYNGVSIYQNGGSLGASSTWYKDNFFTGLTANVGANVGEASSMYGNEDFTMLATGIASKTGYNWELANGKFIVQPSFLMSYTFVNTFDYTNAAGVRISSDPLHAIQIAPGLKFIGNLKNGWQPYIGLQMVWNVMDRARFKANDVSLPNMSVDPYFQYGIGLQKRIGDRFTGFGQAMLRNGGRNGIAIQFGFRWAI
ncbi:MAG: hypothetical protein DKM24_00520 [Candidatus Melainabacteria bacterium]|nr:MAG: hypothetical protein DKM24_00520 [Candidatus Melainabacteria bacterium]